jgi:hypothetical protein
VSELKGPPVAEPTLIGPAAGEPALSAAQPWLTRRELVRGCVVIAALAVIGVPLGVVWQAISPHAVGYVVAARTVIPDQTETFIATDARFVLLTGAVGLAAGVAGWSRVAWRGPALIAALAMGGVAGALVAAWVGRVVGGGHATGQVQTLIMLPIAVRAHGLLFVEALAAVALCCLFTVFTKRDDLRPRAWERRPSAAEAPVFEAPAAS